MNIVKTENGKRLFTIDKLHKCQISSLDWIDLQIKSQISKLNPFQTGSIINNFIIPIIPHEFSDKKNVMKLNFFTEFNPLKDIRLLITSDIECHLNISFNGTLTICKLDIAELI